MTWSELHVECDIPQPNGDNGCGSSDGMSIDTDGGRFCFACQGRVLGESFKPGTSNKVEPRLEAIEVPKLDYRGSTTRKITADTMRHYGAGIAEDGKLWQIYYTNGIPVGAKLKWVQDGKKRFSWVGNKEAVSLYGMHVANHRYKLILCEGELDSMSAYQMTGYAAVSVPFGVTTPMEYIRKVLPLLEKVESIFICTDMDAPGRELSNKLMEMFAPGKAHEVFLPAGYKDANEMLIAGKEQEFKQALYSAQPRVPSGIMLPQDVVAESLAVVYDKDKRVGISTGFPSIDAMVGGLRPAELSGWIAQSGVGKSSVMRQLLFNLAEQGYKSLYVPLEDEPAISALQIAALKLGELTITPNEYPDREKLTEALVWVSQHVTFLNHVGTISVEQMKQTATYALRASGIKVVVLDHITAMAEGGVESATKLADYAIAEFRKLAREHHLHVAVVSHVRKPDSVQFDKETGKEKPVRPSLTAIKHASSIAQACNWIYGLHPTSMGLEVFQLKKARSFPTQTPNTKLFLRYDPNCGSVQEMLELDADAYAVEPTEDDEQTQDSQAERPNSEGKVRLRKDDTGKDTLDKAGGLRERDVPTANPQQLDARPLSPSDRVWKTRQDESHRVEGGIPKSRVSQEAEAVHNSVPSARINSSDEPFWALSG